MDYLFITNLSRSGYTLVKIQREKQGWIDTERLIYERHMYLCVIYACGM